MVTAIECIQVVENEGCGIVSGAKALGKSCFRSRLRHPMWSRRYGGTTADFSLLGVDKGPCLPEDVNRRSVPLDCEY